MQLTIQEINQILESIEAWEKEPMSRGFSDSMLGMMLGGLSPKKEDEDARFARLERDQKVKLDKAAMEQRIRKESAILLKAKLITMRNELTAELTSAAVA